jgi:hypothetical protein
MDAEVANLSERTSSGEKTAAVAARGTAASAATTTAVARSRIRFIEDPFLCYARSPRFWSMESRVARGSESDHLRGIEDIAIFISAKWG